ATSRCTFFFFFQAEDGIRDRNVTGVQTCALPISAYLTPAARHALRRPVPVTVRHDGDDPREMLAWSILAANCSRVRAGVTLAPGGALDDGLFDVLEVIVRRPDQWLADDDLDRKSTRLNSSHVSISYAVFCLNKKKKLK